MTATSAEVRFGAGGVTKVAAHLHLTSTTGIYCFTSDDHTPVLAIYDGHVEVSITVPDAGTVTSGDVTCARMLVEAVGQYVAELERRAAADDKSVTGPGAPAGRAA